MWFCIAGRGFYAWRMRTSIELSDGLAERARRLAKRRGVTLRALVEQALLGLLEQNERAVPFVLEDVTFGEGGIRADVPEADEQRLRALALMTNVSVASVRLRSAGAEENDR